MRWGFICKGVVNGGRGHGVGYRPVVSFSFCFHLLSNLVPLPGHHHSPPRRSRSILIYENRLASSFLEIVVFAFTKDRLSLSLPLFYLFFVRLLHLVLSLSPVGRLWRSRGWPRWRNVARDSKRANDGRGVWISRAQKTPPSGPPSGLVIIACTCRIEPLPGAWRYRYNYIASRYTSSNGDLWPLLRTHARFLRATTWWPYHVSSTPLSLCFPPLSSFLFLSRYYRSLHSLLHPRELSTRKEYTNLITPLSLLAFLFFTQPSLLEQLASISFHSLFFFFRLLFF